MGEDMILLVYFLCVGYVKTIIFVLLGLMFGFFALLKSLACTRLTQDYQKVLAILVQTASMALNLT